MGLCYQVKLSESAVSVKSHWQLKIRCGRNTPTTEISKLDKPHFSACSTSTCYPRPSRPYCDAGAMMQ